MTVTVAPSDPSWTPDTNPLVPEFTHRLRAAWDALTGADPGRPPAESKAARARSAAGPLPTAGAGYGGYGYGGYDLAGLFRSGQPGDSDPVAGLPLHQNVVVTAGINWLARNFSVPDLHVVHDGGPDDDAEIEDHWLIAKLNRPNETRDFFSFFHQCVLSDITDGNTFLLKRKDGSGAVVDLWWLPPWSVTPVADGSRSKALAHYEFRPGFGEPIIYRADEILHVVNVPPIDGGLRGMTPLTAATRSIRVINRIEIYDDSLLMNLGIPAFMLSPADPTQEIQREDADGIAAWFKRKFSGRGVGNPLVSQRSMRADKIGFSPDEMAIEKMPHRHVAHILSVLGMSPMVLGLPDPDKTYSNMDVAMRGAYENALMPQQARFAEAINHDPDLIAEGERLRWDYAHVTWLQEDRGTKIHSLVEATTAGILTVDEARAEIHYGPKEEEEPGPVPVAGPGPEAGAEDDTEVVPEPASGANGDGKAWKFNPNHGHNGRFAPGGGHGGGGGGGGGLPPRPETASQGGGGPVSVSGHGLDLGIRDAAPHVGTPRIGEVPPKVEAPPKEVRRAVRSVDRALASGEDPAPADAALASAFHARRAAGDAKAFGQRGYVYQSETRGTLGTMVDHDLAISPGRNIRLLRAFGPDAREIPVPGVAHLPKAGDIALYTPGTGKPRTPGVFYSAQSGKAWHESGRFDIDPDAQLRRRAAAVLATLEAKLADDPHARPGPDGGATGPGDAPPGAEGPEGGPAGPGPGRAEHVRPAGWAADRGTVEGVLPGSGASDPGEGPAGGHGPDPGGPVGHGLDRRDGLGHDVADPAVLGGIGAADDGLAGAG